jgi:membrane protein
MAISRLILHVVPRPRTKPLQTAGGGRHAGHVSQHTMYVVAGYRGRVVTTEGAPPRDREPVTAGVPTRAEVNAAVASFVVAALRFVGRLAASTTRVCLRYRVTGLAAEAGFFALLSLPPLILGLVASVGYVGARLETNLLDALKDEVAQISGTFLTQDAVTTVILPTFDDVFTGGRFDIVSIGFVLSLWSGSRALNVFVDTISIMYGLGGQRGIVRTRALSFTLYIASLLVGVVVIPLVLVGPGLIGDMLRTWNAPIDPGAFGSLYWPTVTVVAVVGLTTLYHLATPVRTPWLRDIPGALLALVIWVVSSFVLRWVISYSVDGTSIYGPLATPIVLLVWLYFLAIAVLIGAALNAAVDEMFPHAAREAAKAGRAPFEDEPPITPVHDRRQNEAAVLRESLAAETGPEKGEPAIEPARPDPKPAINPPRQPR